ncbi:MAG: STAS/SEC14 domain-containing protein [Sphingorhabdus sp.]
MLDVKIDKSAGYLEMTVDGTIDKEQYEQAVAAVDELLKTHTRIDAVEIVRDIGWIEAEVWWKDMLFHLTHRNILRRAAVVSDNGWVGPVTRFFAPLYPAAIRSFTMAELDEARRWAKEGHLEVVEEAEPHLDFA